MVSIRGIIKKRWTEKERQTGRKTTHAQREREREKRRERDRDE